MNLKRRLAALEAQAETWQGTDNAAFLLSPNDVALLSIERSRIAGLDAPEAQECMRRIDALMDRHSGAIRRFRPQALTPEEAERAAIAAFERQQKDDEAGVTVEERSRLRTVELVGMEAGA